MKGFTLIELTLVIVIVAILASMAVPRFTTMRQQARVADMVTLGAAIRNASTMSRAQGMVTNAAANATLSMDGTTVVLFNRYPRAATGGINNAIRYSTQQFVFRTGTTTSRFRFTGTACGGPATTCEVRYTRAASLAAAPVIVVATTGC